MRGEPVPGRSPHLVPQRVRLVSLSGLTYDAAMGPTRTASIAGLLATLILAVGCGSPKVVGPFPSTAVPASYGYLGWWSPTAQDVGTVDVIHIYKHGSTYMLGGSFEARLRVKNGRLEGDLGARQGRVEVRLLANRHLILLWTLSGTLTSLPFQPATVSEIDDFLTRQIYGRVTGTVDLWADRHGYYPTVSALLPNGAVGRRLRPWPTNPYTGRPIAPGTGPGDFQYRLTAHGYHLNYFEPGGNGGVISPIAPHPTSSPSS